MRKALLFLAGLKLKENANDALSGGGCRTMLRNVQWKPQLWFDLIWHRKRLMISAAFRLTIRLDNNEPSLYHDALTSNCAAFFYLLFDTKALSSNCRFVAFSTKAARVSFIIRSALEMELKCSSFGWWKWENVEIIQLSSTFCYIKQ